ncbi:MAG: hypothetical protein KatS3mg105_3671 [Gemmatales bacterium]|nr:MAG: hypothetical protein KatS3mg105_3671 [Gemmatales bacterium]
MSIAIAGVTIGDPMSYRAITVFPLYTTESRPVDYDYAEDAVKRGNVLIEEVGESGTVPNIIVDNAGETRVLFLEGEELRGAKQNRVLNTTVLVAARTKTLVPVSCVERGRWRYTSKHFEPSMSMSPSKLRKTLKTTVTKSLLMHAGHRSDQHAIWDEVEKTHALFHLESPTEALSDTFEHLKDVLADCCSRFAYADGATGLAIGVGSRIVSFDLFDKPETCRRFWQRIIASCALDALDVPPEKTAVQKSDVEKLVQRINAAKWLKSEAVGEGEEYRFDDNGTQGSALCLGDCPVHVTVIH